MARRRRRRWIAVLVLLVVALLALRQWSRMDPSWYDPPNPADEQVTQLADRVEYRLLEEAQKIRPESDAWTLRVREEQINAWLAARLPEWLAHEQDVDWPEGLGMPQMHLSDGRVTVAVDAGERSGGRVVSIRLAPRLEDHRLYLRLDGLGLGRIPLPGDPSKRLIELARTLAEETSLERPEVDQVLAIMNGEQALDPIVDLADGRRVRLTGISIGRRFVDVTCRTVGRGDI
jgi:hypothetical protein